MVRFILPAMTWGSKCWCWWSAGVIFFVFMRKNRLLVVYGLLRRFTPRNDKGNKRQYPPHRHCEGLKSPWQSRYGIQLFIHRILFLFCFCINFLWFMDCFVVLLLAMTKKNNCHCESCFCNSWQSRLF